MKKQVDAKIRIQKQMEDLDRELYTIETAIDNAFKSMPFNTRCNHRTHRNVFI